MAGLREDFLAAFLAAFLTDLRVDFFAALRAVFLAAFRVDFLTDFLAVFLDFFLTAFLPVTGLLAPGLADAFKFRFPFAVRAYFATTVSRSAISSFLAMTAKSNAASSPYLLNEKLILSRVPFSDIQDAQ